MSAFDLGRSVTVIDGVTVCPAIINPTQPVVRAGAIRLTTTTKIVRNHEEGVMEIVWAPLIKWGAGVLASLVVLAIPAIVVMGITLNSMMVKLEADEAQLHDLAVAVRIHHESSATEYVLRAQFERELDEMKVRMRDMELRNGAPERRR